MNNPKSPFPKKVYERNGQIYKLLANPKRLEILNILKDREVNASELSNILKVRLSNVSQHLSLLRYAKLVTVRRNGKHVYYKISDPRIVELCRILNKIWGGKML